MYFDTIEDWIGRRKAMRVRAMNGDHVLLDMEVDHLEIITDDGREYLIRETITRVDSRSVGGYVWWLSLLKRSKADIKVDVMSESAILIR